MHRIYVILLLLICSENASAQTPSWAWAISGAGPGSEQGDAVATDDSGNVYVAGGFTSQGMIFGTDTFTRAAPGFSIFLIKLDPAGNILWTKVDSSTGGSCYARNMAVDPAGNIYLCGTYSGSTLVLGSYTLLNNSPGTYDVFVVKYDHSGNVLWALDGAGSGSENVSQITVNQNGEVWIGGTFVSTISLGSIVLTNPSTNYVDAYIAKCTSSGFQWAKALAGSGDHDYLSGLAADANGNVVATGIINSGTFTMDTLTLVNTAGSLNGSDCYIAKFNSQGSILWARSDDFNSYSVSGRDVAVDASGDVYATGIFLGDTLVFGSDTMINAGAFDIYILRLDAAGQLIWATSIGSPSLDEADEIAVDGQGDIYISGNFFYSAAGFVIGADTLYDHYVTGSPSSTADIFVAGISNSGTPLWGQSAGGMRGDYARSFALDVIGNVYVSSIYLSPWVAFGTDTLWNADTSANPTNNIYLAKLNSLLTGLPEHALTPPFVSVFPNPFSNIVTVRSGYPMKRAEFRNLLGELIRSWELSPATTEEGINTEGLKPGLYLLTVYAEAGRTTVKLVKQ